MSIDECRSVGACAAPAAAVFAHDEFALLEVGLGDSADAGGLVVGVLLDDAGEAAQLLEALLLPLGDQAAVRVLLRQQEIVQLPRNLLLCVEQVVDVAGALVVDLRYLPVGFCLALCVHRRVLRVLHLLGELVEHGQHGLEALGRPPCLEGSDFGH